MGMWGLQRAIWMGGRMNAMGEEEATQRLEMIQRLTAAGGPPDGALDGEMAGVQLGTQGQE